MAADFFDPIQINKEWDETMSRVVCERVRSFAYASLFLPFIVGASAAVAADGQSLAAIVSDWTPIADIRLRYESVGQVPLARDAEALTLRARLGFQTSQLWNTAVLAEANFLIPIDDRYRPDNAVAYNSQFPGVADPRDHELHRLALINKSLPQTTVTFGRQRIQLDDQRFVGNSPWRQNEQTFDALRVVNTSVTNFTIDATYMDRVHRVYADESPQGTYTGDVFLGNLGYQTPFGKLTAFAYLLSFQPLRNFPDLTPAAAAAFNPVLVSTSTYGGRFSGDQTVRLVKIGYVVSYATQRQRGENPNQFTNDYFLGELNGTIVPVTLAAGDEIMRGNGVVGFSTPLATNHGFDGWADKFLTTPANGLDNRYLSLGVQWRRVGPVQSLSAKVIHRSFKPEHVSGNYGSEWDFQLAAKWRKFTPSVILADYRAAANTPLSIARDTRKLFFLVDFSL
jgi:Alginate export